MLPYGNCEVAQSTVRSSAATRLQSSKQSETSTVDSKAQFEAVQGLRRKGIYSTLQHSTEHGAQSMEHRAQST